MSDNSKRDALDAVRAATVKVAMIRPDMFGERITDLRAANAELALSQIAAEQAGASRSEIADASEWEGIDA